MSVAAVFFNVIISQLACYAGLGQATVAAKHALNDLVMTPSRCICEYWVQPELPNSVGPLEH